MTSQTKWHILGGDWTGSERFLAKKSPQTNFVMIFGSFNGLAINISHVVRMCQWNFNTILQKYSTQKHLNLYWFLKHAVLFFNMHHSRFKKRYANFNMIGTVVSHYKLHNNKAKTSSLMQVQAVQYVGLCNHKHVTEQSDWSIEIPIEITKTWQVWPDVPLRTCISTAWVRLAHKTIYNHTV